MIEMTVVIGVMMLLMAIAVVGYRYVQSKSASDQTRIYLHNAEGLVTELDRTGQGWRLEGQNGLYAAHATLANPGDVSSPTAAGRTTANNYCSNTLQLLVQLPANQTAYGQLSTKALVLNSGNPGANPPLPAALADAWGNPMIWVPSGGLTGVKVQSRATDANGTTRTGSTVTIKSPDGRGFWASAGPSGDFTNGDDNIYSFQK